MAGKIFPHDMQKGAAVSGQAFVCLAKELFLSVHHLEQQSMCPPSLKNESKQRGHSQMNQLLEKRRVDLKVHCTILRTP